MKPTVFQQKVYNFVKTIPKGKTAAYKEVAVAIGYPKACRAVGNVLNKNPRPYFSKKNKGGQSFIGRIPCHRVVRSNGDIGGYVLGTKKKIQLLISEKIK